MDSIYRVGTDFRVHWKRAKGSDVIQKKGRLTSEKVYFLRQKGTFRKSLIQKGFLTQNRAQKGKRAYGLKPEVCGRVVPDPGAELQVDPARGPQAQGLG